MKVPLTGILRVYNRRFTHCVLKNEVVYRENSYTGIKINVTLTDSHGSFDQYIDARLIFKEVWWEKKNLTSREEIENVKKQVKNKILSMKYGI